MKASQILKPPVVESVPTLEALLTKVGADPTLDPTRRKQYAGAIRSLASLLGRPASAIRCEPVEIDRLLREIPRAARARSQKTVANVRCQVKAAISHAMQRPTLPPHGLPLADEWAHLNKLLTEPKMRIGLSRLIRTASHRRVRPEAVNDEFLQAMVAELRHVNWGRNTLPFWRTTAAQWNEAARTIPGWPTTLLTPPEASSGVRHLPLSALPLSFQQDLADYLTWAGGTDRLADDAPASPLRPGTLRLRGDQLRLAASTLAESLQDSSAITSLAVLVEPVNARRILTRYLSRSEKGPTAFIRGLALVLVTVAKQWVNVPVADLKELSRLKRRLGSESNGLTEKNRTALRYLQDKRILSGLLTLPTRLRGQLKTTLASPARRLQRIQIALAIEILLVAPMRLQNLAALRLDRQLQWPSGRGGSAIITLNRHETKNSEPLEYPIEGPSKALLEEYLDHYRHHFAKPALPWLFIDADGSQMKPDRLRDGITKAVRRELGIALTPHQFRHVAAAIALDARPGAIGLVKDLLGHKSIKTTTNFYVGMRTREASREYDKILMGHRLATG